MIYSIIFLLLAALSCWYWRAKFIPSEVARNLAAFAADGSNDSLQRGYHARETWRRIWVGLACCVVPAVPLVLASWGAAALGFLSAAALLAGVFCRDFTPKLNAARIGAGETWLGSIWRASPASKSWPDASAWGKVRRNHYSTDAAEQLAANDELKSIILSAWHWCLAASLLLGVAAVWVAGVHF